ncbi:flagellar hook-length control protein FliK [Alteromonadaceae bacterium Bs31]|nr:flagellar hook-length control protein FliK [Alteromonadaceae bacterium Bs31]
MHSILDVNSTAELNTLPPARPAKSDKSESPSFKDSLKDQQAEQTSSPRDVRRSNQQTEPAKSEAGKGSEQSAAASSSEEKMNSQVDSSQHKDEIVTHDKTLTEHAELPGAESLQPGSVQTIPITGAQELLSDTELNEMVVEQGVMNAAPEAVAEDWIPESHIAVAEPENIDGGILAPLAQEKLVKPLSGVLGHPESTNKSIHDANVSASRPLVTALHTGTAASADVALETEQTLELETFSIKEKGALLSLDNKALTQGKTALEQNSLLKTGAITLDSIPGLVEEHSEPAKPAGSVPIFANLVSSSSEASAARMQMPVNISFGKPEWNTMVAERAAMMAAQNITTADLQLDPPELGPLQVRVQVHNDQVSVHFTSAHANVRDALDQSAMRLRELCEQQGMNLLDVNVSDQQQGFEEHAQSSEQNSQAGDEAEPTESQQSLTFTATGGIDYYA